MNTIVADLRLSTVLARMVRLFIFAVVLAVFWFGLNFTLPELQASGISMIVVRFTIYGVILVGLWLGLSRTDFDSRTRLLTWLAIVVPLTAWLATAWALAIEGVFRTPPGGVPRLPFAIFIPILVGLLLLTRSKRVAAILAVTPPSWLIGVQVYRIFGGIFLVQWASGNAPGVFALPAGTGDVLVGLLALPVAAYLQSGAWHGRAAAYAWNLLGLLDLAVAVGLGFLSSPGRFQLLALDQPNVLTSTYPTAMIPAFGVPSSIILHGLSLWQLRRPSRKEIVTPNLDAHQPQWNKPQPAP